jgi:hypothetical protein
MSLGFIRILSSRVRLDLPICSSNATFRGSNFSQCEVQEALQHGNSTTFPSSDHRSDSYDVSSTEVLVLTTEAIYNRNKHGFEKLCGEIYS